MHSADTYKPVPEEQLLALSNLLLFDCQRFSFPGSRASCGAEEAMQHPSLSAEVAAPEALPLQVGAAGCLEDHPCAT